MSLRSLEGSHGSCRLLLINWDVLKDTAKCPSGFGRSTPKQKGRRRRKSIIFLNANREGWDPKRDSRNTTPTQEYFSENRSFKTEENAENIESLACCA